MWSKFWLSRPFLNSFLNWYRGNFAALAGRPGELQTSAACWVMTGGSVSTYGTCHTRTERPSLIKKRVQLSWVLLSVFDGAAASPRQASVCAHWVEHTKQLGEQTTRQRPQEKRFRSKLSTACTETDMPWQAFSILLQPTQPQQVFVRHNYPTLWVQTENRNKHDAWKNHTKWKYTYINAITKLSLTTAKSHSQSRMVVAAETVKR